MCIAKIRFLIITHTQSSQNGEKSGWICLYLHRTNVNCNERKYLWLFSLLFSNHVKSMERTVLVSQKSTNRVRYKFSCDHVGKTDIYPFFMNYFIFFLKNLHFNCVHSKFHCISSTPIHIGIAGINFTYRGYSLLHHGTWNSNRGKKTATY